MFCVLNYFETLVQRMPLIFIPKHRIIKFAPKYVNHSPSDYLRKKIVWSSYYNSIWKKLRSQDKPNKPFSTSLVCRRSSWSETQNPSSSLYEGP